MYAMEKSDIGLLPKKEPNKVGVFNLGLKRTLILLFLTKRGP